MQPPLRMSGMANPSIPGQLREVVQAAREAGATGIWTNLLFLRPGTREHLAPDWPELLPHSRQLYRGRAYLGAEETKPIRRQVSALAREFGVADRRSTRLEPEREPEQLTLAV
jgi:hypothetical protein